MDGICASKYHFSHVKARTLDEETTYIVQSSRVQSDVTNEQDPEPDPMCLDFFALMKTIHHFHSTPTSLSHFLNQDPLAFPFLSSLSPLIPPPHSPPPDSPNASDAQYGTQYSQHGKKRAESQALGKGLHDGYPTRRERAAGYVAGCSGGGRALRMDVY